MSTTHTYSPSPDRVLPDTEVSYEVITYDQQGTQIIDITTNLYEAYELTWALELAMTDEDVITNLLTVRRRGYAY